MSKISIGAKPTVRVLRPRRIYVISGPKVICEVAIIGPDGKVKSSSRTERPLPDLILIQFRDILAYLLSPATTGNTANVQYRDVTNTLQSLNFRGVGASNYLMIDDVGGLVGGTLAIGADPTAATRTDYELTSKTAEFPITSELSGDSSIIKQGAWLATGAGTVYETGFYVYLTDTAGVQRQFLIFHDIPTPQAYILNDSVQITYTIQL